jgi:hypothetical protein
MAHLCHSIYRRKKLPGCTLFCIGTDAYHKYTTMEFEAEDDKHNSDKLLGAFERRCVGEVNEVYERYVFHHRQQKLGEIFDTFVGDLRRLLKSYRS